MGFLAYFVLQAALQAVPDGQVSGFCSATVVDSTTVVTNGNCCYSMYCTPFFFFFHFRNVASFIFVLFPLPDLQDAFDLSDIYVLAGDTNLFVSAHIWAEKKEIPFETHFIPPPNRVQGSTLATSQRVPVVRMTTHRWRARNNISESLINLQHVDDYKMFLLLRYFTPGVSGSRGNICVVNLDPSNPLDLSTDFVGGVPPNDGSLDLDAVTSICYLAGWGSTNLTDPDQEFTAELVYRQVRTHSCYGRRGGLTHGRRMFSRGREECLKNCYTPQNGSRGGDTFCPPRGGVEEEKGLYCTNRIFAEESRN